MCTTPILHVDIGQARAAVGAACCDRTVDGLIARAGVIVNDRLTIVRDQTTTKQSKSGDCGIFAIKYIEFLSI